MHTGIRYVETVPYLLERVPELQEAYARESKMWWPEVPGAHIVFGSLLPELLKSHYDDRPDPEGNQVSDLYGRAFMVVEHVAGSLDPESRNLIEVSFLEHILGDNGGALRFARFLGPASKKLGRELCVRWGLSTEGLA